MTKEEIEDELYRMLSDVVNGGYPKRNNTQRGRYRKAVEKAIEALEQEPCTDAISRQAAIDEIWDGINMDIYTREVKEYLEALPPVKPTEKVGRWIARGLVDSNGNRIYECSECHHSDTQAATMIVPYCWYCGAKMQEVEE